MPMVRAMRLLNAIEGGTTSGVQLQTLLGDAGRKSEFRALLQLRGQSRRMAASDLAMSAIAASGSAVSLLAASSAALKETIASATAMATLVASATAMATIADSTSGMEQIAASPSAMNAMLASPTAIAALTASPTAMAAIAASATAMGLFAASNAAMTAAVASVTAKMAFFNSDTALNAIAASATAMAACRAAAKYSVVSVASLSTAPQPIALTGTSHIVLGASTSAGRSQPFTLTTLRAGSVISAVTPNCSNVASITGADFNVAIPLVAPRTAVFGNTISGSGYLGVLRCDA